MNHLSTHSTNSRRFTFAHPVFLKVLAAAIALFGEYAFAETSSSGYPFSAYDIAGTRLGMSVEEIRETLRKNGVRSLSEFDSQLSYQDDIKHAFVSVPNTGFKNALWGKDGVGTYSVFFSPETGHERPVQIRYVVGLDSKARVTEDAFLSSVSAKYSRPMANWNPLANAAMPNLVTNDSGPRVVAWSSNKGRFSGGLPSSCYFYATALRNQLSPSVSKANNPVFQIFTPPLGNVTAECGDQYFIIEYIAQAVPLPNDPTRSSGVRLVGGYTMVLVDARASEDSVDAAVKLTESAKRSSYGQQIKGASQTAPPKL